MEEEKIIISKIDEILQEHHLKTSAAANRAMEKYGNWVAEKFAKILELEKERAYNRGYVDCAKTYRMPLNTEIADESERHERGETQNVNNFPVSGFSFRQGAKFVIDKLNNK